MLLILIFLSLGPPRIDYIRVVDPINTKLNDDAVPGLESVSGEFSAHGTLGSLYPSTTEF